MGEFNSWHQGLSYASTGGVFGLDIGIYGVFFLVLGSVLFCYSRFNNMCRVWRMDKGGRREEC